MDSTDRSAAQALYATRLVRADQLPAGAEQARDLALDHAARQRARQRLVLDDGQVLAIVLPSGSVLKPGDWLLVDGHPGFRIVAAPQTVLRASSDDPLRLARAAYHLGNRHCTVQIAAGVLQLEPDPVLAELLVRLGLEVTTVCAPFEPESGAYGGGHRHGHDATFASDHALAQATFRLYEGVSLPGGPLRPTDPDHG